MRFLLAAAFALAAPPVLAQGPQPAVTLTYVCAGGEVLRVAYLNTPDHGSFAVLDYGGQLVPMEAGPVASGVRYVAIGGGGLVWHVKGPEGFVARDEGASQVTILDACMEQDG
jgi:membrane-bound inhibitor of C-type lysozyme